jgi:hypothetical protein
MSAVKTAILARQFMAHINLFMVAQDSPLPLVTCLTPFSDGGPITSSIWIKMRLVVLGRARPRRPAAYVCLLRG